MQYSDFAAALISHIMTLNPEQWQVAIGQLNEHLASLDGVVDKCEAAVRPVHDSVKG